MKTTFQRCFLVNFAVEPDAMRAKIPCHLQPELYEGRAYLSIVIAKMLRMRPAFIPPVFGITYTQVVYRVVVRCGVERGVYFLRSDADSRLMVAAGNALTFFKFNFATVRWEVSEHTVAFSLGSQSEASGCIAANFDVGSARMQLPTSSRFPDLNYAEAFLTNLYTAFGQKRSNGRVEAVRISRSPWRSRVVTDRTGIYDAMTSGALFCKDQVQLDCIFQVEDLAYYWNPLKLE